MALDSVLSIVQMPAGVPVATTAIGVTGAKNAALLALQILGVTDKTIEKESPCLSTGMHAKAVESGDLLG